MTTEKKKIDARDAVFLLGVVSVLIGIGSYSWRAGVITFGVLCLCVIIFAPAAQAAKSGRRN